MEVPMDDIKKLTLPKQLLVGGGVLTFIFSFFDWFTVGGGSIGGYELPEFGGNGWDVGFLWGGLPALAGLAAAAIILLPLFNVKLPEDVPWGMIAAICGLTGALVVLKLLFGEDGTDRAFGLYLASLGGAAMTAGGVMTLMDQNK